MQGISTGEDVDFADGQGAVYDAEEELRKAIAMQERMYQAYSNAVHLRTVLRIAGGLNPDGSEK